MVQVGKIRFGQRNVYSFCHPPLQTIAEYLYIDSSSLQALC